MIKPCHGGSNVMHFSARWQGGSVDHQHWQSKRTRCSQFCRSPGSASVFRHDQINPVRLHQRAVNVGREWAAINNHMRPRQGQRRFGRVHQPQQVEMLWLGRKSGQVLPPDRQHHAPRRACKGRDCARDIGHIVPIIARLCAPRRAAECQTGQRFGGAGCDGIAAHLGGERMRGVNQMRDAFGAQICAQAFDPAKAAQALGQWLAQGALYAPGEREHTVDPGPCHSLAQGAGFGGATKDKKASAHV